MNDNMPYVHAPILTRKTLLLARNLAPDLLDLTVQKFSSYFPWFCTYGHLES